MNQKTLRPFSSTPPWSCPSQLRDKSPWQISMTNRMAEVRFHRWLFVWVLIYRSLFVRSLSNSHKQCAQCQCFPVWIIDDSTPWPPLPTPRSLSSTNHADHWSTTKHIYIYILCQPKSRISYRFIMDQRDWLQQMRAYVLLFGLQ